MVYSFITKWGNPGSDDGEFDCPNRVAIDPSQKLVFVADMFNKRIQEFSTNGQFIKSWGDTGSEWQKFSQPIGVAVDTSSHVVYAADKQKYRIQKFTFDGALLKRWGAGGYLLGSPNDIAVDSEGNVFVLNRFSLQKFTNSGQLISSWGSLGLGNVSFGGATALGVDPKSGDVYVGDNEYNRVEKLDNNCTFIETWYQMPPGEGVGGITVDEGGDVFVSFHGAETYHRVEKFTKHTNSITKWGTYGSGDGEFYVTLGVAVDTSGHKRSHKVYVSEYGNNRIQVFGWT